MNKTLQEFILSENKIFYCGRGAFAESILTTALSIDKASKEGVSLLPIVSAPTDIFSDTLTGSTDRLMGAIYKD